LELVKKVFRCVSHLHFSSIYSLALPTQKLLVPEPLPINILISIHLCFPENSTATVELMTQMRPGGDICTGS
jgi:hypothetical protein